MMGNEINLLIDGIPVRGEITHRSTRDIGVQICAPYKNFSAKRHIPSMAAGYRSFIGTKGDLVAEELLRERYVICQYLDTHFVALATELAAFLEQSEYPAQQADLTAKLKGARHESPLKNQHLKGLKRNIDTLLEAQLVAFLDSVFPMQISKNMAEFILAAIQGKLAFK
ncbi:MAG: hypothetical protein RIR18_294 [Pseudomonadota bacterium]